MRSLHRSDYQPQSPSDFHPSPLDESIGFPKLASVKQIISPSQMEVIMKGLCEDSNLSPSEVMAAIAQLHEAARKKLAKPKKKYYGRKVVERYLTEDEEKRLFAAVKRVDDLYARRDYGWMLLIRHTGLRVSTVAGLTVGDVRSGMRNERLVLRSEIMKRGKAHEVRLNKKAMRALQILLAVRKKMGYAEVSDEPLMMSRKHKGLSVRSLQARMKQWGKAADLGVDASPHWLRHTMAMRYLKQTTTNNPLPRLKRMLGHSSFNSVAVYVEPSREDVDDAWDDLM